MTTIRLALAGLLMSTMAGCASYNPTYPSPSNHLAVNLRENNFQVVESHISSSADCGYILGGIPAGDPNIYGKALLDLRKKAGLDDRPRQFVNFTEDYIETNFFFFKKAKVTLTADVIEFQK